MSKLLALALLAAASLPATAQIATTVGPSAVPLGGQLSVTFSNDNPGKFGITTNLWSISDAGGAPVYSPTTPGNALLMGPGGWYTFRWDLRDQAGATVPPGSYRLDVQFDTWAPVESHVFEVRSGGAGLVLEGTASIQPVFGGGPGRNFYLTSPADAGQPYWLLASGSSSVGIPTCGGTFPLDADPLLLYSIFPNALIPASFGTLNAQGESTAPRLQLPNDASLVGLPLHTAFLVLDPKAACVVERSSSVHVTTVVP